jgi:hypothetical protein
MNDDTVKLWFAYVREKLYEINSKLGLRTPTICTPEELIGEIYE